MFPARELLPAFLATVGATGGQLSKLTLGLQIRAKITCPYGLCSILPSYPYESCGINGVAETS